MAAPAFKTALNPPTLCPEIPTLFPTSIGRLNPSCGKKKCSSWIYSTLLPVLGIPSLIELLHAPPGNGRNSYGGTSSKQKLPEILLITYSSSYSHS